MHTREEDEDFEQPAADKLSAAPSNAEDEEDDALVAEKIRLLLEENARLRAVAAQQAQAAQPDGASAEPEGEPQADGVASGVSGVADWLLAAAKEREKAALEARAPASSLLSRVSHSSRRHSWPLRLRNELRRSGRRAAQFWRRSTAGWAQTEKGAEPSRARVSQTQLANLLRVCSFQAA